MRFTTLSTLTNAFIISTVTLQSLIQVANASATFSNFELTISDPAANASYYTGDVMKITWFSITNLNLSGHHATVYLRNEDIHLRYSYYKVNLIENYYYDVVLPYGLPNSSKYYIEFTTLFGDSNGNYFTINNTSNSGNLQSL